MYKAIPAAFVAALTLAFGGYRASAAPTAAPAATYPPEITHVTSHRLCTALRKRVGPSIGMMLQNDKTIAKGPALFDMYNMAYGNKEEGARNIALLRMENMVGPIANNVIAIKKELDDTDVFLANPQTEDDRAALRLRADLLRALAAQEASLDIVNGFVVTQQMADLQHADEGLIKQLSQPDVGKTQTAATPDPLTHNIEQAGLAPDPYQIDPASIPGLTLGYNPVTRLNDGLKWTQKEAAARESTVAQSVASAVSRCGGGPPASPKP